MCCPLETHCFLFSLRPAIHGRQVSAGWMAVVRTCSPRASPHPREVEVEGHSTEAAWPSMGGPDALLSPGGRAASPAPSLQAVWSWSSGSRGWVQLVGFQAQGVL